MGRLKANIIFNFLGSAWLGVLTLAVTPIQVHYLGVEAFGFVGLITILQVLLGSLDLGIAATVTKIVSSDHSEQRKESADALNTASTVYWCIAFLIAVLLWINSTKVADFWLSSAKLDPETLALGIQIIAVYLGLRWPIAFYAGVIGGLQRMDILNIVKASTNSLRLVGGAIVLFFLPDLIAFLVWFAISSFVEILIYAVVTYRLLPSLRRCPMFSLASFKSIWRYSLAINAIALAGLILSQADRVAVTKLLTLEALGYYSIAYNASIVIALAQSAINNATFPAFSHSFSSGQHVDLLSRYEKACQLMGVVLALPCFALIFFGHDVLSVWINASVANEAALTMSLLAFGFFLNSMVSSAHMVALACGQTRLPLSVNLVAPLLYVPALFWLVPAYGINGAAAAYVCLSIYYVVTLLPLVQSKVVKQSTWLWLRVNLFPFALAAMGVFGGAKILSFAAQPGLQALIFLALGAVGYVIAASFLLSDPLRADLSNAIKRVMG